MIIQPEQYEINKMKKGDIVYVIKRPLWYRLLRKYVLSNKEQVTIRTDWVASNQKYNTYYKEDCILIYGYELLCKTTYNNQIDYFITYNSTQVPKRKTFKSVIVNLYNVQFLFEDGTTVTVPLDRIKLGIRETEQMLKNINRQELVETQIKFMKYKGDYFKNLIQTNNIKQLVIMYCSVCGKCTLFKFKKKSIDVINKCNCGNTVINLTKLTYDEFAVWYASQTDGNLKKNIDKQLFISKGK